MKIMWKDNPTFESRGMTNITGIGSIENLNIFRCIGGEEKIAMSLDVENALDVVEIVSKWLERARPEHDKKQMAAARISEEESWAKQTKQTKERKNPL